VGGGGKGKFSITGVLKKESSRHEAKDKRKHKDENLLMKVLEMEGTSFQGIWGKKRKNRGKKGETSPCPRYCERGALKGGRPPTDSFYPSRGGKKTGNLRSYGGGENTKKGLSPKKNSKKRKRKKTLCPPW